MHLSWLYLQSGAVARVKQALISGAKEMAGIGSSICRGQQSDQLVMAAVYNNWRTVVKNVLHSTELVNIIYNQTTFLISNVLSLLAGNEIRL